MSTEDKIELLILEMYSPVKDGGCRTSLEISIAKKLTEEIVLIIREDYKKGEFNVYS